MEIKHNIKSDLAFIRELVSEADAVTERHAFGVVYGAAGIIYGTQCILSFAFMTGAVPSTGLLWTLVGVLPTVAFLTIILGSVLKEKSSRFGISASNRAINGAFAGAAIASVILAAVFGFIAHQQQNLIIWLIFPIVVCALQGGLWFMAAILRRSHWYGAISSSWFITTLLLGIFINQTHAYVLIIGVFLLLNMALPGYIIVRRSKEQSPP